MPPFYRRPPRAPSRPAYPVDNAAEEAMRVELEALDHVGLVVSDMARSIRWYTEVLGLRRAHEDAWGEFPAVLEANGSGVALFPSRGRPVPVDDPMRHVGFRTSRRGLEAARAELTARGIEFREGDYGVAWSVYLPDPDGYQVEITTYEPA
jgi:catechol 2,3-dioxygenase-like lactoylglutathione lyase family enzyme